MDHEYTTLKDDAQGPLAWLKRLGFWGIWAVVWNGAAFGLIAAGFDHLNAHSNRAQWFDLRLFMMGYLAGFVGVGWSIVMTIRALHDLVRYRNEPRSDRRRPDDAIAILALNLTILLGWALLIYGQFAPPANDGWW